MVRIRSWILHGVQSNRTPRLVLPSRVFPYPNSHTRDQTGQTLSSRCAEPALQNLLLPRVAWSAEEWTRACSRLIACSRGCFSRLVKREVPMSSAYHNESTITSSHSSRSTVFLDSNRVQLGGAGSPNPTGLATISVLTPSHPLTLRATTGPCWAG